MVSKTTIAVLCLLLVVASATAQDNYNQPGTLSASATFSPGFMTARQQTNFYLHGFLDARLEKRVSVRGDVFYLIGANGADDVFSHHHTGLFGAAYHMSGKSNFDPYIGLQPGISVSQLNSYPTLVGESKERAGVSPVISAMVGVNCYVTKHMHFFASARYMAGRHFSTHQGAMPLSEVSISAGLGFNISCLNRE